jgi:hypothetical protein
VGNAGDFKIYSLKQGCKPNADPKPKSEGEIIVGVTDESILEFSSFVWIYFSNSMKNYIKLYENSNGILEFWNFIRIFLESGTMSNFNYFPLGVTRPVSKMINTRVIFA